ncbi:MAG: NUDIX hydrolase [Anaerolineales bacterium]|nr:NUDIX hydrolase [Anaerolineales bacterium]
MIQPWEKLQEKALTNGRRRVLRRTFQLPDGQIADYDIKHEPRVVAILPITADQRVVLACQFRPGPEKVVLELPGGGIEDGETPEHAARRELLEETGYTGEIQPVGVSLECAYSTAWRYNFVATDCHPVQDPSPDSGEFIDVVEMPLADFRRHLRSGQLSDVETGYMGLDYLGLL